MDNSIQNLQDFLLTLLRIFPTHPWLVIGSIIFLITLLLLATGIILTPLLLLGNILSLPFILLVAGIQTILKSIRKFSKSTFGRKEHAERTR